MNEILSSMNKYVDDDEKNIVCVVVSLERETGMLCYQQGIVVATTRRMLYYRKFPYYPTTYKEYSYVTIDSIDFHPYCEFTCNNETIRAK
ncbi:PH domain-containing protein, partial [Bacillus thuringiensis]|uniref:PH domain-containing protein n=1 Tax=Bacillus thuringiensis TaxID=1428 RepID=UPI00284865CD